MKIKTITLFLFLLTSILIKAQSINNTNKTQHIATYAYTYLNDSANSSSLRTTYMTLCIGDLYSKFEHESRYYKDSLLRVYYQRGATKAAEADISAKSMKVRGPGLYTRYSLIKKQLSDTTILMEDPIKIPKLKVIEADKINWQLSNTQEKEISHYHCKKATTTFKGRNYTAWYTLDIPISEGPYKFRGLPGLIVKIEDSQARHSFVLSSFMKSTTHRPIYIDTEDYQEVSMKEYYKAKKAEVLSILKMYDDGTIKFSGSISQAEMESRHLRQNNYIERL